MEKIHGTSAHIDWKENKINYFSGGEKYEKFLKLFNEKELIDKFTEFFKDINVTLFGEAYGGKQQGMSKTYGKDLKFVVFDVKIGNIWLNVPNAENVTKKMGLEFVSYNKVSTDLKSLDAQRDLPSVQAKRNGILEDKIREGIVLRPLIELTKNNGERVIVKYKRDEFLETKTKREVNPKQLKVLEDAKAIAEEWVTPNRLENIMSHLKEEELIIENTGKIIKLMKEDVFREAKGEIVESKEVITFISKKTALLYKNKINKISKKR